VDKKLGEVLTRSFKSWRANNPAFLAAGISYYTVFSIIPALILVLAFAGRFFKNPRTQATLIADLAEMFNPDVAASIEVLLQSAEKAATTATIFGVGLLVWGASHMFLSLQYVLNVVWEVPKAKGGIRYFVAGRLKAFAMIFIFCLALVVFFTLDLGLAFVKHHVPELLPGIVARIFIQVSSYGLYLSLFTILFAMIFKFLPQTRVAWRNVWTGAFFTAVMFALARTLIALYFSIRVIGSFYGAAGSVIVVMVWVYLSMQIFLFGAQFTHEYGKS
jgi:membrane protein